MRYWISQVRYDWRKLPLSTCTILHLRRTISLLVVNIPLSKLANVIDFKAHFPVVSIIFRLLVCFKSWQNRVKVYDRVLMDSDTIFVCFEAVWQQVFDGDFLTSKNEGKDLYVQRKKCHRSGYFSHIENFSCEQCNVPFWITLNYGLQSSCGPLRKQPSHPRESTSGSSKVSLRGLIPFCNTYHKRICAILFENNRYKSLALNMWMLCQHQNSRLMMYFDHKMWVLYKARHVD